MVRKHVGNWQAMSGASDVAPAVPTDLQEAVLLRSEPMPADSVQVKGHDFSEARLFVESVYVLSMELSDITEFSF